MSRLKAWGKRLLVVPPIAVGVALLAWQIGGRDAPERAAPSETPRPVRVIEVTPARFVPRALGYGHVLPGTVWEAVAQVSGRIVERHPDLERGRLLEAGTLILRIDPADYDLAVARNRANLDSAEAQLAELLVREANTGRSREIEQRRLALAEEDLARKRTLLANGNTSQATVDQAETTVLTQHQRVQELDNQLALFPSERQVLEASLALGRSQLAEAELDLARTEIRLPFDARIAEVLVERDQFAAAGQRLVEADSIDVAEVTAQMAIDRLLPLVGGDLDLTALTANELAALPQRWGLNATVRLRMGELEAAWRARFDRLSDTIDPQTRTLGVIVAVDEPYRKAIPGRRPPLAKNMFAEVELSGAPRDGVIVVPRMAVHRGADGGQLLYVVGADDRLEFRPVRSGPAQDDFVVIENGVETGDRVVVTDLIPAIEGMLLDPTLDPETAERLIEAAAGSAAIQ
ncbi:MAG: efflux RND transporter periplasmic adaptor subunit [Inquilinus sp.]|nr:efflux RND transporter periplasmic adaptor subunit [Inquilinus sp.]